MLNAVTSSEMHKTNPAVIERARNMSELPKKQDSIVVTRIENAAFHGAAQSDSRNLHSQPPNLTHGPMQFSQKPSQFDIDQKTATQPQGRRTMIKNNFQSSNRGSSHN